MLAQALGTQAARVAAPTLSPSQMCSCHGPEAPSSDWIARSTCPIRSAISPRRSQVVVEGARRAAVGDQRFVKLAEDLCGLPSATCAGAESGASRCVAEVLQGLAEGTLLPSLQSRVERRP